MCLCTWVGDSGSTILSYCSKNKHNGVHSVVCCNGGQDVPKNKQTNTANITEFTVHVFVAVMVRLYQEAYTKQEWKKDQKEMEVKILCFKPKK